MKNLVYVSAIAFMGLIACGAPAGQNEEAASEEAVDTMEVSVDVVRKILLPLKSTLLLPKRK